MRNPSRKKLRRLKRAVMRFWIRKEREGRRGTIGGMMDEIAFHSLKDYFH